LATTDPIHPQVSIGHVHLKVSDLDRAERFYRDVLGFEVQVRWRDEASFLSAGGYHHHIGLNTWYSKGGPPAPPHAAGLFHVAILYPSREELARAVRRVLEHGVVLTGASDHGVSEAIYLRDPDGNGIELYRDRPRDEWPTDDRGELTMFSIPLDIEALLADLPSPSAS
jgi:catechol 2,3-dioxygenase